MMRGFGTFAIPPKAVEGTRLSVAADGSVPEVTRVLVSLSVRQEKGCYPGGWRLPGHVVTLHEQ